MAAVITVFHLLLLTFLLNSVFFLSGASFWVCLLVGIIGSLYFLVYNIIPSVRKYPSFRLKVLGDGADLLLAFFVTGCASLPLAVAEIVAVVTEKITLGNFLLYLGIVILGEAIIFWNGIIRVYLTSLQLGIRTRVLGIILGWIPVANFVMLMIIYTIVRRECKTEFELAKRDEKRKNLRVCDTKYPILLVHGVFFRDSKYLNYWGRVPAELEKNGARIFYGEQQSALAVEDSARELSRRIEQIIQETGCEKVNIIAHSKGGLDSRYAISKLGADKYVASLTTINTPHKGCIFAEYLLEKAPAKLVAAIEATYNKAFEALGDKSPDFMAAVKNLTSSFCTQFNAEVENAAGVMYQSYGSKSARAASGRFPLNVSYPVVKKFDGDNDGLVALDAMSWGEKFTPILPTGKRGITHADMIDLNRENFKGFDVREFYVGVVSELKERGF